MADKSKNKNSKRGQGNSYEVFLGSDIPADAIQPSHLGDPVAEERFFESAMENNGLTREKYASGYKEIREKDKRIRFGEFFDAKQAEWAETFYDRLSSHDVRESKISEFLQCIAHVWTDGKSDREEAKTVLGLKSSIEKHDQAFHSRGWGKFVDEELLNVAPTFKQSEIRTIFEANSGLLQAQLPDYMECFGSFEVNSMDDIYLRRGIHVPITSEQPMVHKEKRYMSSYTLDLGTAEQFARTWNSETRENGVPCVFSVSLPIVQERIIAFSPFIKDMTLKQLEVVVAPPMTTLYAHRTGEYDGIIDFEITDSEEHDKWYLDL